MTILLQLTQPWVFLTFYIIVHSDLSSSHKKPLGLETNLTLVYLSLYLTLAFESQGLVQYCLSDFFSDGFPLIGKVPGYKGAYIATGHSCWGILNGPATGEALAQMILGLEPSVQLDRLSPGRFLKCRWKGPRRGFFYFFQIFIVKTNNGVFDCLTLGSIESI